ncbi:MAG: 6-pyruvoyl tetrahydrobiopterin synthase, partial [Aquificae bacterium]|nr:6-pyruvoyl tetrahydrobiopterin synthase [Aquificota bacterium]
MPYVIRVKRQFHSAHYLTSYKGKPEPLHGHTWEVELFIKAERLDEGGIGFDFVEIQEFLKQILPDYRCM